MAELFRPGDQSAVARDLIVLDRLRRADDGRVKHVLVGHFAGDLIAFLDQAVNGGAFDALRLLAQLLERLVETLDLVLRFFKVVLEALREIPVRRLADQFRQRLNDLVLGE
jgi:hypothetical protein